MQPIRIEDVFVAGVIDHDATPDGIVLRRLPAWTRHQLVDPALQLLVTMPAGARIELVTDATALELDVMVTSLQVGVMSPTSTTFDLVVDGTVVASADPATCTLLAVDPLTMAVDVTPGEPATLRFDLPEGDGEVEVWLPHAAVVELRGVRVPDGATWSAPSRRRRRWVHYGSSISHCLESPHPTGTWPAVAARAADVDLTNLAVAGQCMLDQHVARTIRDLDADLISVKAGINIVNGDTMRERTFVPALHGFLDTVRDGHPTAPLLVVTPIICPAAEAHPGPTLPGPDGRVGVVDRPDSLAVGALSLGRIRELVRRVVDARRQAGDENLHLLEGLSLFGEGDLDDLPDGLHPNAAGYQRMGERFHDLVFEGGPFSVAATPEGPRA